jgi:hypothetical protein
MVVTTLKKVVGCSHHNKSQSNCIQCLFFHVLVSKIILMLQIIKKIHDNFLIYIIKTWGMIWNKFNKDIIFQSTC